MIDGPQRHLFDIPADVTYLNCSYLSPHLREMTEVGRQTLLRAAHPWTIGSDDFFAEVDGLRDRFAQIVGGDAEGVAVVPSVSYGVQTVANNADLGAGDEIVLLDEQFPSDVYPWRRVAAAAGARIVTVPRPADLDWAAAIVEHIGDQTRVVAVPTCHWTDGSKVDLAAVGERTRAVGAWLVVDGSQSLGSSPFSVAEVEPDWLVSVGYKGLLGPYRIAFMWVAPQHRSGMPLEETWQGREGSSDFSRLVDYTDRYRRGAARFDSGEAMDFITTPMAVVALARLLAWGTNEISTYVTRLTDRIEALAVESGLEPVASSQRLAMSIGIRFPDGPPPGLVERLAAERIHVSLRGDSMRVSPHVYNSEADVDRLFEVIG